VSFTHPENKDALIFDPPHRHRRQPGRSCLAFPFPTIPACAILHAFQRISSARTPVRAPKREA